MADSSKSKGFNPIVIIIILFLVYVLVGLLLHCRGTWGTGVSGSEVHSGNNSSFTVNGITYTGKLLARQNTSGNLNYADFVVQPHEAYIVSQYNMDTRNAIYNIVDCINECSKNVGAGSVENTSENAIHIFVLDSGTEIVALRY